MSEKQRRGFALMSHERVRAIASLGGKAAQATGRAHTWTLEECRRYGARGGTVAAIKGASGRPRLKKAEEAL